MPFPRRIAGFDISRQCAIIPIFRGSGVQPRLKRRRRGRRPGGDMAKSTVINSGVFAGGDSRFALFDSWGSAAQAPDAEPAPTASAVEERFRWRMPWDGPDWRRTPAPTPRPTATPTTAPTPTSTPLRFPPGRGGYPTQTPTPRPVATPTRTPRPTATPTPPPTSTPTPEPTSTPVPPTPTATVTIRASASADKTSLPANEVTWVRGGRFGVGRRRADVQMAEARRLAQLLAQRDWNRPLSRRQVQRRQDAGLPLRRNPPQGRGSP